MGKLSALKRGITKGIAHTLNPKKIAMNLLVDKLVCISCKHPSNSHTETLPQYKGMEGERLYALVSATGYKGSGGFDECKFYICKDCPAIIVRQALSGCKCAHEETKKCQ